jgi:hypothetical protein
MIELQAEPVGSVGFSVWNLEGLHQKAAAGPDETVEAIGRGSAEPLDELGHVDKAVWSGSFVSPGPYYVCGIRSATAPQAMRSGSAVTPTQCQSRPRSPRRSLNL